MTSWKNALVMAAILAATVTTAGAETFNGVYTVDDATNTGPQNFSSIDVGINADGTFNILDGRLVRSTLGSIVAVVTGASPSVTGIVNVTGNRSRLEVGDVQIGTNSGLSTRTAAGFLNIEAGGHVRAESVGLSFGSSPNNATVTVSGPGSLLEIVTTLEMHQFSANRTSTVRIAPGGTVSVGTTIVVAGDPRIILEGGTLSLTDPSAVPAAGIIQFNSGAFRFRSNQTLDGGAGVYTTYYGSPPILVAGRGLAIDGTTTVATTLRLDGGSLRTERIAVDPLSGSLILQGGTLTLTGEGAVLDSGADFGPSAVTVGDGSGETMLLELGGAGDVLLGDVAIAADGALTFGGETLIVDSLASGGRITIDGAALHAGSGFLNTGSLSIADAEVKGDVNSPAGSSIDVVGAVVFNGGFTGAAAFYGSGTVVFNGTVSVD